jgi:hypothetical protein
VGVVESGLSGNGWFVTIRNKSGDADPGDWLVEVNCLIAD